MQNPEFVKAMQEEGAMYYDAFKVQQAISEYMQKSDKSGSAQQKTSDKAKKQELSNHKAQTTKEPKQEMVTQDQSQPSAKEEATPQDVKKVTIIAPEVKSEENANTENVNACPTKETPTETEKKTSSWGGWLIGGGCAVLATAAATAFILYRRGKH